MVCNRIVLAMLLAAGVYLPGSVLAQTADHPKHSISAAAVAACRHQANAKQLHYEARLDFMQECLKPKNKK